MKEIRKELVKKEFSKYQNLMTMASGQDDPKLAKEVPIPPSNRLVLPHSAADEHREGPKTLED